MGTMKRFILATVFVLALALVAGEGRAEPFTVVTSEDLKATIDRQEPDMVIIDARNPEEFQESHIRTAVNIPWTRLEKDKGLLNFSKERKIVFYCNGFK